MSLMPILVAGYGRSGTTAVMALLGSNPRIAFDRCYPFENRYLTYLAKFAGLASRPGARSYEDNERVVNHDDPLIGPMPWSLPDSGPNSPAFPTADEWAAALWSVFSEYTVRRCRGATHYAEKTPAWLWAALHQAIPCRRIALIRDPRDVFLSANAFNRARGWLAFGRRPDDTDRDYARTLAYELLAYFENYRTDRGPPDGVVIRYEDLIAERAASVARLGEYLDLPLSDDPTLGAEYLPAHMTSAAPAASVARWKREPLPLGVQEYFERHLLELMATHGYESAGPARAAPSIDLAAWANVADGTVAARPEGGLSVSISGPDFWLELLGPDFPAESVREIWVCLRCDAGSHCSLYWRRETERFHENRSVHTPFVPGRHWQIMRFRVGAHVHWRGTIAQVRLDVGNGPGARGTAEIRWVRLID